MRREKRFIGRLEHQLLAVPRLILPDRSNKRKNNGNRGTEIAGKKASGTNFIGFQDKGGTTAKTRQTAGSCCRGT
ncbi:MAG TPA: hypothetical protein VHE81_10115 [Lacipirellulaceae bacterium]|nr:hypothetical protein [Lacipirellulaceae bacterium]